MNLENVNSIYFVGIGGIGMSAAAGIAAAAGFTVYGSDSKTLYDPAKTVLDRFGIEYFVGYDAQNLKTAAADLYIVSSGEDQSNPEVQYLETMELSFYGFSELLYELSKDKLRAVVAGTHGKSTTAGLFGHILHELDDSSFMTGGVLQGYNTNFEYGGGHYFVFEGDEYKSLYNDPTPKFHYYKPDILVLTNLEYDHPDLFSNFEEMMDEFRQLIANLPDDGLIVYNADDVNLVQLVRESEVTSFGFALQNEADYKIGNVTYDSLGTSFSVSRINKGELKWQETYRTQLAGQINVYNAAAVITTLRALGFESQQIQAGLGHYRGVKRRFEKIGERNGVIVYDDYAHHPTAVKETLAAARTRHPDGRIWAVFEPHTYSRTAVTLKELVTSFKDADEVLIAEIYPAREHKTAASITGQQVVTEVAKYHPHVRLVADKEAVKDILRRELKSGDVVIIMAVGNFNTLAPELVF